MANPNPRNQFSSTNQPASKKTSAHNRTLLVQAIEKVKHKSKDASGELVEKQLNEADYLQIVVEKSLGDPGLMREVITRLNPVPKPVLPECTIDWPDNASPMEKIEAVTRSVSKGEISADVATMVINMIKTQVELAEKTELMERIERIEAMLKVNNGK
jgi:hypothetical protein